VPPDPGLTDPLNQPDITVTGSRHNEYCLLLNMIVDRDEDLLAAAGQKAAAPLIDNKVPAPNILEFLIDTHENSVLQQQYNKDKAALDETCGANYKPPK